MLQLAYFLLLSVFPFLMFLIAILSYVDLPVDDAIYYLSLVAPPEVITIIDKYITYLMTTKFNNLLVVAIIAAFWTSSTALGILADSLNQAYGIHETRGSIRESCSAIPFTLLVTICIAIALIIPIFSKGVLLWLSQYIRISSLLINYLRYMRWVVAFLTLFNVIALIYYIAPDVRVRFREILPGTFFAAIGWILSSLIFTLYVKNVSDYSLIYGSIGAVIVLMIWLFWAAMIIILGGELNAALSMSKENYFAHNKYKIRIKKGQGKKSHRM